MNKATIIILKFVVMSIIAHAQNKTLDSFDYTTALVEMVEQHDTGCHYYTIFFTFRILEYISGPRIEANTLIQSQNLAGYKLNEGGKIISELYGNNSEEKKAKRRPAKLVINFTFNPKTQPQISEYDRDCDLLTDEYNQVYHLVKYFKPLDVVDKGISFVRWAAATDSQLRIEELDQLIESKYDRKLYLLGERNGEFYFTDGQKDLRATHINNKLSWVISEIKKD